MMKFKSKSIAIAMAISSFTAFGCGSAPTAVAPVVIPVAPIANPGFIGQGMVGNGACIPLIQNQPIGFQANNLYTDNFQSVYAGNVPYIDTLVRGGGVFGQVTQTAGGAIGAVAGARTIQTMANRPDGSLIMNISSPGATTGMAGTGTGNGVITISAAKMSIIYGLFGLSYPNTTVPYTGPTPQTGMGFYTPGMTPAQLQAQNPCVSGIAVSMSFASLVGNYIDGGRVYLYLNNTMHGMYLQF